jgi:hypothetical protein
MQASTVIQPFPLPNRLPITCFLKKNIFSKHQQAKNTVCDNRYKTIPAIPYPIEKNRANLLLCKIPEIPTFAP